MTRWGLPQDEQEPAEKRLCTGSVAFVTQEHINDLSMFIDRTMYVEFLLAAKAEYFINGPLPPDPPSVRTDHSSQLVTIPKSSSTVF
jgi:hypothetical protein